MTRLSHETLSLSTLSLDPSPVLPPLTPLSHHSLSPLSLSRLSQVSLSTLSLTSLSHIALSCLSDKLIAAQALLGAFYQTTLGVEMLSSEDARPRGTARARGVIYVKPSILSNATVES